MSDIIGSPSCGTCKWRKAWEGTHECFVDPPRVTPVYVMKGSPSQPIAELIGQFNNRPVVGEDDPACSKFTAKLH